MRELAISAPRDLNSEEDDSRFHWRWRKWG